MHTRRIWFTSQWALVGVILFYALGTALIAWHRGRIITPASAGGSEHVTMSEISNLPEPLGQNYWYNSATCIGLLPLDEDGANLRLFGDVCGAPTSPLVTGSPGPLENPESDARDFDMLDILRADNAAGNIEEDELILHAEQFSDGSDTNETPPGWNIEETNDTEATSAPAIQVLTRIRTQAKCVEAILKKAVIEPYLINGQIEGLQITGLEKILIARDLLIKSGDIIRAVNGQPLNSKRGAYEIFKRARKLPIMKIELLRDGKTETLLYYLR